MHLIWQIWHTHENAQYKITQHNAARTHFYTYKAVGWNYFIKRNKNIVKNILSDEILLKLKKSRDCKVVYIPLFIFFIGNMVILAF